jgi:hypothetical protein
MRNNTIKPLLLEIITENYGKIEFQDLSLCGKDDLIMPKLQEYNDSNSELLCLVSTTVPTHGLRDESFQLAFEYNLLPRPLRVIYLDYFTNDQKTYHFNYVKEIKDFAEKAGIIKHSGMGPIEYKNTMREGFAFWEEFHKGEEMYMAIRKDVKEYIIK